MKLIAKVASKEDEIQYLGIEYDETKLNEGVFLYYLLEKDFDTCQHDSWFPTLEDAQIAALEDYGVRVSSWEVYS